MLLRCSLLLLWLCAATAVHARPDTTFKAYYGLLHAHTMICDGSGTPAEAYAMAKAAGLHFFAVTPHNHIEAESGAKERKDGVLIAKDHNLYNGTSPITLARKWKEDGQPRSEIITITPLLMAARQATTPGFVALYGQEFSTISSGNHVNVLGIDHVLECANGNYKQLLAHLSQSGGAGRIAPVVQLNHPEVEQDLFRRGASQSDEHKMFNDYGIDAGDLGPHFRDWAAAMQPYTHLIEVLSGPAMATAPQPGHHYTDNENDYFFYLTQGLHVSPSAGQDNHYKTWGTVTSARTGIMARNLSEASIYDAFRRHRTFATEDNNLLTALYINDSLMGSGIHSPAGAMLGISLLIKDADEPGARYDVFVYGGNVAPELSTAATRRSAAGGMIKRVQLKGNGLHKIDGVINQGQAAFCYIKVVQQDGDRSWTAPVWINEGSAVRAVATTQAPPSSTGASAPAKYFWTSNGSKVYHVAGCPGIAQIKPANLRTGNTPPDGRRQHECGK